MNEKVFLTDDCISREAALAVIEEKQKELCPAGLWGRKFTYNTDKYDAWQEILEELEAIPSADVKPVRHGRWECVYDDNTGETDITCSHCKNTRTVNGCFVSADGKSCYFEDDYCPNCGAKMDLEDVSGKEGKGK